MTTRVHIGIPVRNVDRSLPFYQTLFGVAPAKVKPGYAKFSVADPSVNFTLNQTEGSVGPINTSQHYGVEVGSAADVDAAVERFAAAGISALREDKVTCCYAEQDKAWFTDPDGNRWEVFVVNSDADVHTIPETRAKPDDEPCCEPTCCT